MNSIIIKIILGIISILIIKDYIEIMLEKKKLKYSNIFWVLNVFAAMVLEVNSGIPLVNLILNFLFVFMICLIGYRGTLKIKLIMSSSVIVIWAIIEVLLLYLARVFQVYLVIPELQGAILSKLIMLLIVVIIKNITQKYFMKDTAKIPPKYSWLLISIPVCCIAIIYYIYSLVGNTTDEVRLLRALISSTLFLPLNLMIFKIYDLLVSRFTLQKQNIIYEQSLNLLTNEIREKEDALASKQLLHDCKNHLLIIQNMAKMYNNIEIQEYIKKVEKQYEINRILVNSGNIVIDALINSKYSLYSNQGIECKHNIIVPENMQFEDADVCILLGNALDNAYTAAKTAFPKEIDVSIVYSCGRLKIGIKNTYDGNVKKDIRGNYITTKKNSFEHGLGILLMKKVVEKYEGFIELKDEKEYFVLVASLKEKDNL